MSYELVLRDPLGERTLAARELPLEIGGEGVALALPGIEREVVLGAVGVDEHGLFVRRRPANDAAAAPLLLNSRPLAEHNGLSHGDVLTAGDARIFVTVHGPRIALEIRHSAGNATVAPPPEELAAAEAEGDSQSIRPAAFKPAAGTGAKPARRGALPWAVAAGVAVLGSGLWFVLSATPVHVTTTPAEARVRFTGGLPVLRLGSNHLLHKGNYTLTASHQGYETQQRIFKADAQQQLRVDLKKLPGRVRVETGTVVAEVLLKDQLLGKTPGEFKLEPGKQDLVLRAPRHLDLAQTVTVAGADQRQLLKLRLKPNFSPVTIESKPAGARVSLNGRDLGVTPLTTEVDAGSYTLKLEVPSFRAWESSILVAADEPQRVGPVELGLADGKLALRSTPADADVTVGGRYRGRTPLEVSLAPGVQYAVEITRAGYEPSRRSVPVEAGARQAVEVKLTPIPGQVTVRGEPADAQLFVDGELRGPANQSYNLPSAELKLEVKREGYLTYTTSVTPQPGFARVVEYKLLTPAQAKAARIPGTLTTSAGGKLKLMPTGSYQMGSDRREPGRRTNESQRNVTLSRAFYIGIQEISNKEFLKFRAEHLSGVIRNRTLDQDNHPVVNITWNDAAAFCNWLSAQDGLPAAYEQRGDQFTLIKPVTTGYRLPTEAEWEWAARYENGRAERRYPWGASLPPTRRSGNFGDSAAREVIGATLAGYEDGFITTGVNGAFPANPLGLFDMGGNVSEWIEDFYTADRSLLTTPTVDPLGPESGTSHVIRDSNWRTIDIPDLRLTWRDAAEGKAQHIGFRIARYAE